MSAPVPPENFDYYKLRGGAAGSAEGAPGTGPERSGPPRDPASSERLSYIVMGLVLQAFGGLIVLVGATSGHDAADVIGGVIAWVGAILLFVGLVAVGVRLGTEELVRMARQQIEER